MGFNVNDDVVSVRNVGGFSRDEKQWKGKKLAIEGIFDHTEITYSNNLHNSFYKIGVFSGHIIKNEIVVLSCESKNVNVNRFWFTQKIFVVPLPS